MKHVAFTEDELRTLIWAIQSQHAQESLRVLKKGEAPKDHATIQKLNSISKKAYTALVAGKELTK